MEDTLHEAVAENNIFQAVILNFLASLDRRMVRTGLWLARSFIVSHIIRDHLLWNSSLRRIVNLSHADL